MTIRQVLLNGTGTDGDGTTWNDASDATSAYIGTAGFRLAFIASAVGDIVYVKGVDTTNALVIPLNLAITLALARNPVRVLGCKSATTNNQGSIVESDLIVGIRTGGPTPAYDDADVPSLLINHSTNDFSISQGYWYGVKITCSDDIVTAYLQNGTTILEECLLEVTGASDAIFIGASAASSPTIVKTINSKFSAPSGGILNFTGGASYHYGSVFDVPGTKSVINQSGYDNSGHHEFHGCDLSVGGETTILTTDVGYTGLFIFNNCKFPASWVLTGGTPIGGYRVESYGSDDTTGLTTAGSEQQINIEDQHGTIVTETTKVRTGGADDGAAGIVSWDMSTFASGTALSVAGLESPWMYIWVAGDGTSQTVTVYFASDTGNTEGANWTSDEIWMEVLYPDDGGTSQYDYDFTVANLLAAGSVITDGTDGEWASGGVRAQELSKAISPDYEGYVKCRVVFAPGANAETIYVDPLPVVT